MAATIRSAIDANRVDLYLQPMVTLPQRKIRYYEALSRLRSDKGDVVLATDFLGSADAHGLMPKIDNLVIFRCVQVVRRLLAKNREVGLFCNISGSTLTDGSVFPQLLEFLEANRAVSSSIVLEIPQSTLSSAGPIELESLSALAQQGYRFSLDNVTDLRFEPRELLARGCGSSRASCSPAASDTSRCGPTSCLSGSRSRAISIRPISPICSAVSGSILSPSGSRAKDRWSICSNAACASARALCSRRRGRYAPKPCRGSQTAASPPGTPPPCRRPHRHARKSRRRWRPQRRAAPPG
jgi:hypothetical protein